MRLRIPICIPGESSSSIIRPWFWFSLPFLSVGDVTLIIVITPPPPSSFSRTQHIISAASGHQVSNRGGAKYSISGKDYNTSRNQKLKQQFTAAVVKPGDDTGAGSENAVGADSGGKAVKETFVVQSRIFGM